MSKKPKLKPTHVASSLEWTEACTSIGAFDILEWANERTHYICQCLRYFSGLL